MWKYERTSKVHLDWLQQTQTRLMQYPALGYHRRRLTGHAQDTCHIESIEISASKFMNKHLFALLHQTVYYLSA